PVDHEDVSAAATPAGVVKHMHQSGDAAAAGNRVVSLIAFHQHEGTGRELVRTGRIASQVQPLRIRIVDEVMIADNDAQVVNDFNRPDGMASAVATTGTSGPADGGLAESAVARIVGSTHPVLVGQARCHVEVLV